MNMFVNIELHSTCGVYMWYATDTYNLPMLGLTSIKERKLHVMDVESSGLELVHIIVMINI